MSECDIDVRRYRSLFATGRRRILVDSEITPIRDILSFFHLFSFGVWQTIVPAEQPSPQPVRRARGVISLPAFCWVWCSFTNRHFVIISSSPGMLLLRWKVVKTFSFFFGWEAGWSGFEFRILFLPMKWFSQFRDVSQPVSHTHSSSRIIKGCGS